MSESGWQAEARPGTDRDGFDLRVVPAVLLEVIRLAGDDETSVAELSEAIMKDGALSARTLSLANSSFFGRRRNVDTVDEALVTIGMQNAHTCVVTGALMQALGSKKSEVIDMRAFWQESLLRACIARAMSERVDEGLRHQAYLAALLADLAVPILANEDAAYAEAVRDVHCCQASIAELEKGDATPNHAARASRLCQAWGLPSSLQGPIASHHEPPPTEPTGDRETRLWQIAFVAGNLPLARLGDLDASTLELAAECFAMDVDLVSQAIERGIESYGALTEVFAPVLPEDSHVGEILEVARSLSRLRDCDLSDGELESESVLRDAAH